MNCFDSVFPLLQYFPNNFPFPVDNRPYSVSINQGRVSLASPGLILALTCKGFERKEKGFYPMHSIHEGGVLFFFLILGNFPEEPFPVIKVTQQILCKLLSLFRSHCHNKFTAMASVSLSEFCWFKIVLLLCIFSQGRVPMASCELVPAMFDPETKQVIYNPGQTRTQKKDLVVTIAQDVKTEKSSRTSKSESFGLNLGFQNSGIPSFGVNYQKVKINEQRQESHHQVNIVINIPSDCDEGCKKHADEVFQLANNALYSDAKHKHLN